MKITITSILFPVLSILAVRPTAAQEEDHSTVRGLKTPAYTVVLDRDLENPGVYYGTSNGNGNWVIATSTANKYGKRVRIGLRAHEAYVGLTEPNPAKPFEFIYETGEGVDKDDEDSGIPRWNFDFEFDSDVGCSDTSTSCTPLSTYEYEMAVDVNPTIATTWVKFDPVNVEFTWDHSFGRSTATETDRKPLSTDPAETLLFTDYNDTITGGEYHVAQNSLNYGFLASFAAPFKLSPYTSGRLVNAEGIYDIVLSIKARGSGAVLAKAAIRVLVKDSAKCDDRGKCFPTIKADCNKPNIDKFNMFFTSNQKVAECVTFVAGIKQ